MTEHKRGHMVKRIHRKKWLNGETLNIQYNHEVI